MPVYSVHIRASAYELRDDLLMAVLCGYVERGEAIFVCGIGRLTLLDSGSHSV